MKAKRVNNTIVKNGVTLYIFNNYPTNFIDDKVENINKFGLDFAEMGVLLGDKPIIKSF